MQQHPLEVGCCCIGIQQKEAKGDSRALAQQTAQGPRGSGPCAVCVMAGASAIFLSDRGGSASRGHFCARPSMQRIRGRLSPLSGLGEAECKQRSKETPSAVTLVKHVVLPHINLRRVTMPSTRKKKLASPKRGIQNAKARIAPCAIGKEGNPTGHIGHRSCRW